MIVIRFQDDKKAHKRKAVPPCSCAILKTFALPSAEMGAVQGVVAHKAKRTDAINCHDATSKIQVSDRVLSSPHKYCTTILQKCQ